MTDINTPDGSLRFVTVSKHINGSVNGSENTGDSVLNVATSFSDKKTAIGSDTHDFLGIYEWKVYRNVQNFINELTTTTTGGGQLLSDKNLTSIVADRNGSISHYVSSDGWQTFSSSVFSNYIYDAYGLGRDGTLIGRSPTRNTFNCMEYPAYVNGNTIDIEDGNIQHIRSMTISEDGTTISVGHNNNSSNEYISTYPVTGTTIGSRISRKSSGIDYVAKGDINLTDDGSYIIGVSKWGGGASKVVGFSPSINTNGYNRIDIEGEFYIGSLKVTNVSPEGKSYAIPIISYRSDGDFFRFIYPADTGTGYDMFNMIMHAKIPRSLLPDGAFWATPISFTEMMVGGNDPVSGDGFAMKMNYTPLTNGF